MAAEVQQLAEERQRRCGRRTEGLGDALKASGFSRRLRSVWDEREKGRGLYVVVSQSEGMAGRVVCEWVLRFVRPTTAQKGVAGHGVHGRSWQSMAYQGV